jgi:hypothetical protein
MVRYAHRRRLQVAANLIAAEDPGVVLDWGACDGYLAGLLIDRMRVINYEPTTECQSELRRNFPEVATRFEQIADTKVDAVACLEVMEHMALRSRLAFYRWANRALPRDGLCVLSVPVEIGPAVALKESVRVLRKGRAPEWKLSTLLWASFGAVHRDPARFDDREAWIQWHNGFDYRALREELREHFRIEKETATPLGGFPWLFNQTVIFKLRPHQ